MQRAYPTRSGIASCALGALGAAGRVHAAAAANPSAEGAAAPTALRGVRKTAGRNGVSFIPADEFSVESDAKSVRDANDHRGQRGVAGQHAHDHWP